MRFIPVVSTNGYKFHADELVIPWCIHEGKTEANQKKHPGQAAKLTVNELGQNAEQAELLAKYISLVLWGISKGFKKVTFVLTDTHLAHTMAALTKGEPSDYCDVQRALGNAWEKWITEALGQPELIDNLRQTFDDVNTDPRSPLGKHLQQYAELTFDVKQGLNDTPVVQEGSSTVAVSIVRWEDYTGKEFAAVEQPHAQSYKKTMDVLKGRINESGFTEQLKALFQQVQEQTSKGKDFVFNVESLRMDIKPADTGYPAYSRR